MLSTLTYSVPPSLKSKRSGLYSRLSSSGEPLAGTVVKGKPSFVSSSMSGEPTAILLQSDHSPPGHWTINPQGLKQIGVNEKNIPRPFVLFWLFFLERLAMHVYMSLKCICVTLGSKAVNTWLYSDAAPLIHSQLAHSPSFSNMLVLGVLSLLRLPDRWHLQGTIHLLFERSQPFPWIKFLSLKNDRMKKKKKNRKKNRAEQDQNTQEVEPCFICFKGWGAQRTLFNRAMQNMAPSQLRHVESK